LSVKEATEQYQLALNILSTIKFVTLSVTALLISIWSKISAKDKIVIKNVQRKKYRHQMDVCIKFRL